MERCLPIWCTCPWPSLSTELEAVGHRSSWLKPSPLEHATVHIFICDLLIFSSPWTKDLGLPSVKKQSCLIEKENLLPHCGVKCCHVVNRSKKGWSVLPSQINAGISSQRRVCPDGAAVYSKIRPVWFYRLEWKWRFGQRMTGWPELMTGVGGVDWGPCYRCSRSWRGREQRRWTWDGKSGENRTAMCFKMENWEN